MPFLAIALSLLSAEEVSFPKVVLDPHFVAEGVAVGDVNRDGKVDILAATSGTRLRKYKPHGIAPVPAIDPNGAYSNFDQFERYERGALIPGPSPFRYPDQIGAGGHRAGRGEFVARRSSLVDGAGVELAHA